MQAAGRTGKFRAPKSTIRLSGSRLAYVCTWTLIGVSSAVYVVGALLAPHEVDRMAAAYLGIGTTAVVAEKPVVDPSALAKLEASDHDLQAKVTELQSNLAGLSKGMAALQLTNGLVKTHLKAIETGHPLTSEDISADEKRLSSEGALYHPATPGDGAVVGVVMDGASIEPLTIEQQAALPAGKVVAKAEKPKSVSQNADNADGTGDGTGALDQALADQPVLPPKKQFGIELVEAKDTESLRSTWEALHDIQPKLLDGLSPQYAGGDGANGLFRLLAGPLATNKKAVDLCKKLSAQNIACKATAFTGDPL